MELGERLEHAVRDESTSWHPGVTHLEQRLAEGAPEDRPTWSPPKHSPDEEGPR